MSVFNQSRSRIIRLIFTITFIIIVSQLVYLQVVSGKYQRLADENAILKKTVYPPRGIVFDRKRRAILNNTMTYDLMVTPSQLRGLDTTLFCQLMNIDTAEFNKRIITAIIRNRSFRPSVFEASLSEEKYVRLQENLWRLQNGFYIQERPIRSYPYNCGANIVGYIGEVDSNYLKNHSEQGYQSGDYAGMTGMENSYEKALMGERGVQYLIKDNFNRIKGPYENGTLDEPAMAGNSLYTSLDVELQELGEKLMTNKVGAIIAIDPRTGGILAMVSSPTYNPALLTGSERRKNFAALYKNPQLPLLNRTMSTYYPPGSTFKTLQALVALHEGMITPQTSFSCSGAFYGCGKPMRCLDPGVFQLTGAITHSCNTYFANVMQRVINNPKYPDIDSSLRQWARYMNAFGLGHKLGVDLPSERSGSIPTPATYNKVYGEGHWNFCTFRSVSIGQGEVLATPLQVANEMAYLANKGWFITPHVVDSIAGGDKYGLLKSYKEKHFPLEISDEVFEAVHDGMQGVVDNGTGRSAKLADIVICGKTGTAENYYKGVKQKDHAFFAAFAPRSNPRIAIAVICEIAGTGGSISAPIAGLMIEKYLNDTIAASRKPLEERITNTFLIPARMLQQMKSLDSLEKAKAAETIARNQLKELNDTLQTEEAPDEEWLRQGNKEKKDSSRKMSFPGAMIQADDPMQKRSARQAR
ncbi:MAG TPA: penicillin-binding protein 2 [Chitinophagaceae bacterium]|nr:penicillin-binding protein 2 [Chitinophagaceae bacterium]